MSKRSESLTKHWLADPCRYDTIPENWEYNAALPNVGIALTVGDTWSQAGLVEGASSDTTTIDFLHDSQNPYMPGNCIWELSCGDAKAVSLTFSGFSLASGRNDQLQVFNSSSGMPLTQSGNFHGQNWENNKGENDMIDGAAPAGTAVRLLFKADSWCCSDSKFCGGCDGSVPGKIIPGGFKVDVTCSCPPGFSGDDCSQNIDDCDIDPCTNDGVCVDGVDDYSCTCPVGLGGYFTFGGKNCEINLQSDICVAGTADTDGYEGTPCSMCEPGER